MSDFKRVLLKLSGEVFSGSGEKDIDPLAVKKVAGQIAELNKRFEVATVNGAGNIWRHRDNPESGMSRVESDYRGMNATILNAEALRHALEDEGLEAVVNSAFESSPLERILRHQKFMNEGKVVLCAGGTGHPFFTTDSAAALCALELGCDVLLKATTVDGVYDSDPDVNSDAVKYDEVTYDECLAKDLKVMDGAAIALCRDNQLPLIVFRYGPEGNIEKALRGEIGTRVVS
jgi:uridylate kinase